MNYSSSEENYLKAIYHLQEGGGTVGTNAVAEKLNTKAASVTDMMKKLSAKGLLHYTPYYGFSLSNEGRKIALSVVRRHRLWEYFLANRLQFDWKEVHSIAEELEHVSSKKLIDKLDEYLGYPQTDPHGDPIPDSKGRMTQSGAIPLTELGLNLSATILQVTNQSDEILEHLKDKQLQIGTLLEVKKLHSFDRSLDVKRKNKIVTITHELAKSLLVKIN
ncbi:MAG TPA: metal-dependent transcriptional regulator [Flavisolibacter sp.]|nr:metal-dependent transcriptional regulator [Flavisolibacter sp.]